LYQFFPIDLAYSGNIAVEWNDIDVATVIYFLQQPFFSHKRLKLAVLLPI